MNRKKTNEILARIRATRIIVWLERGWLHYRWPGPAVERLLPNRRKTPQPATTTKVSGAHERPAGFTLSSRRLPAAVNIRPPMDASIGSAGSSEMKASPNIVLRRGNGNASAPKRGATGRPSTYTEAKAAEICRRMVEGESLRTICKAPGMPGLRTMFE